jgi:hypothetical protein
MSEFDNLVGDAEQEAKDHPQQVHEAEQDAEHAVENKFGGGTGQNQGGDQGQGSQGQGDQQSQGDQQNQAGDSGQGQGQSGHDQ